MAPQPPQFEEVKQLAKKAKNADYTAPTHYH